MLKETPDSEIVVEAFFVLISFILLVGYHTILAIQFFVLPDKSLLRLNIRMRQRWAVKMTEIHDQTAIQTMRNLILGATFMSSSISLALVWAGKNIVIAQLFQVPRLDWTNSVNDFQFLKIKILVIALVLFASFFCFIQSIRYCAHLGFYLNVGDLTYAETVQKIAFKITFSFWLAMRGLYCGIPVCSYVFGPSWLLGTTIMIVLLLQRADSLHFTDCIMVCCTCCRRKRKDTSMEDVPHF